ncbi:MAG: sarcosine oxidase subunit gamma family protein [Paracoccaceae bacterium]
MPSLIAKSPLDGVEPASHGPWRLSEADPGPIALVAALPGQAARASAALKKATGLGLPEANRIVVKGGVRAVWSGREQCLVLGAMPTDLAGAVVVDQSDGWAMLRLDGPAADRVLSRLVPVDLRPSHFGEGQACRAPLGHMQAVILRAGEGFEILVFRSMAKTAWHEIETAMRQLAARSHA